MVAYVRCAQHVRIRSAGVLEKVQTMGARRVTFSGDLNTLGKTLGALDDLLHEASKNIRRLLGPSGEEETSDIGDSGETYD
jgi:hypothetical protein